MRILSLMMILLVFVACSDDYSLKSQEEDKQELSTLLNEIESIASSEVCINPNDWEIVAIGSKACGGPAGYIAYSKSIQVEHFLSLVENYTEKEKSFNLKWGVISDCAITNPPQSVECEDGITVLVY